MEFRSINPYNQEVIQIYSPISNLEMERKIELGHSTFNSWRKTSFEDRKNLFLKLAQELKSNTEVYARMITLEMGKPISESRGEILKCAWVGEYYAENAERFLQDEIIETEAKKSFVRHDPLGVILAIMPWNFPFWQVFRFAAPTIMAGNVALLKHAPNVFGCAQLIEELFLKAGFPKGVFQNLIIHHNETEKIITHPAVKAVSLTGSERAGKSVAEIAGRYLKKCVLELGGSNAFIIDEDVNLDDTIKAAVTGRFLNAGQSCIAAKRFLVHEKVYDEFLSRFKITVNELKSGDPLNEETRIGTLARIDLAEQLNLQVEQSIKMGAELLHGGTQKDCFYEPTILINVTCDMPVFREETFGPVAAIMKIKTIAEAIKLSNESKYGLGVTIFSNNLDKAINYADEIEDGAYFINEFVKSDPRLPFGGTKNSGYGRELSRDGILEFINRKIVYLK